MAGALGGTSAHAADTAGDLKQRLQTLKQQRDSLEAEVAAINARLNAPGQPGLKGSLLDKEGFPRADIDVHQVRRDRNRLACLTNDHKDLSQQLSVLLEQLHAATRHQIGSSAPPALAPAPPAMPASSSPQTTEPRPCSNITLAPGTSAAPASAAPPPSSLAPSAAGPEPMQEDTGTPAPPPLVPFAMVTEVDPAGPAAEAGIQAGDMVCSMAGVAPGTGAGSGGAGRGDMLPRVAAALQAAQGQVVTVAVLRHGLPQQLQLVPRTWAGRGLLGCHLRPL